MLRYHFPKCYRRKLFIFNKQFINLAFVKIFYRMFWFRVWCGGIICSFQITSISISPFDLYSMNVDTGDNEHWLVANQYWLYKLNWEQIVHIFRMKEQYWLNTGFTLEMFTMKYHYNGFSLICLILRHISG